MENDKQSRLLIEDKTIMGEELEIIHISSHGVWLLANGPELFMLYDDFPWFKDVSVGKILNVEQPTASHFYWRDLDVD